MADEIVVDRTTLKALGADTRLEILHSLQERQRTLTELSKSLKMSHSTVKEHMQVLAEAGLVNRVDEGRKWKYYHLTMKGRRIVAPEEVKALFVFILSAVAAGVLFLKEMLARTASTALSAVAPASTLVDQNAGVGEAMMDAADAAAAPIAERATEEVAKAAQYADPLQEGATHLTQSLTAPPQGFDPWTELMVLALIIALATGLFLFSRHRKRRGQPSE